MEDHPAPFADHADALADAAEDALDRHEAEPAIAGPRHAHPERPARPSYERIIASNGYNAIRNVILSAPQTVAAVDLETFDAAIDYAGRALARMRLDANTEPAVRDAAIRNAEYELTILRATRKFRRDLKDLDDRQAARDRIAAR